MVAKHLFRSVCLLFAVHAARVDVETAQLQPGLWVNDQFSGLQLNPDPRGPLLPAMVPPLNSSFELQSIEQLDLIESNEYRWAFVGIRSGFQAYPINQWFATLQGSFLGNIFGKRRTTISNNMGQPLFLIELSNWIGFRWSWRILNPVSEDILFTINKDVFGAGFLGIRDEWRIYRGRQRDGEQIYHVVGGYLEYEHEFFHSKEEYLNSVPPCGVARQNTLQHDALQGLLPDSFGVTVQGGEDSALLLATTVIIDLVHETEAATRRANAANERANRRSDRRSARMGRRMGMGR